MLALAVLAGPAGAQPFAYLPDESKLFGRILDTATNTFAGTFPVGEPVFVLVTNVEGSRLYASRPSDVAVIDTASNTIVRTIQSASGYLALDSRETRLYIGRGTEIGIVDIATGVEVGVIPLPQVPVGLALDPEGDRLYVTQYDNYLSIIDTTSQAVITTISTGSRTTSGYLNQVAINASGTRLYVSNPMDDAVVIIDATTNTVVTSIDVRLDPNRRPGPFALAVNPSDTRLYVVNSEDDSVVVIDTALRVVVARIPVDYGPRAIGLVPAANRAYVFNASGLGGNPGNATVSVIDTATNTLIQQILATGSYLSGMGEFIPRGTFCGDGVVLVGESCDAGEMNGTSGSCCTQTCSSEPAGSSCWSDGSVCTDDVCDGGGSCLHLANTGACEDGLYCTVGDACAGGACQGGVPRDCGVLGDQCHAGVCDEAWDECAPQPVADGVACDDGSACTQSDACSAGVCLGVSNGCGNGAVEVTCAEECDDGGVVSGDGCSSTCRPEPAWACTSAPSACAATCGNGQLDAGESCDDGNVAARDGCTPSCVIEPRWSCFGSPSTCTPACGDGHRDGYEQCDDGGAVGGDGCEADCTLTPKLVSSAVIRGDTLSSDLEGNGVTVLDPIEASVTSPISGVVSITRRSSSSGPAAGFSFFGQEVVITAPAATALSPLRVAFLLDASLGSAVGTTEVAVLRNGVQVPMCTGPAGHALPDPCVASRALHPNGEDLEIVVLTSAASVWSFAADVCGTAPDASCRLPVRSGKAAFRMSDAADSEKDAVHWKWLTGAATTPGELAHPSFPPAYTLCVYDADGPYLRLVAPAGGICDGKPCWTAKRGSVAFKSKAGSPDGVQQLQVKAGVPAGKAKASMKGRGVKLRLPSPLGVTPPVTVQLRSSTGTCWGATYTTPDRNDAVEFKAKAD